MKKIFALLVFAGMVTFSLQAQNCSHAKSAEKASMDEAHCQKSAAKAASLDTDIEKRVDPETGDVTYVRKSVCEKSGKVSFTAVEYSDADAKFVNVSPQEKAGCGSKSAEKSCCSDKAGKASKTSMASTDGEQKAGCAGTAAKGASCCSKKKASAKSNASSKVKLVKSEEN